MARIGHVIHNYKPILGGGEVYVAELIRNLSMHEHVVFQEDTGDRSSEIRPVRRWILPIKSFRKALQLQHRRELNQQDLLISHDLLNLLRRFAGKTIGVCHGVNWQNPLTSNKTNRQNEQKTIHAYQKCLGIVANDSDFFRQMGISELEPRTRLFEEIQERRWFIPNCIDTEQFRPGPPLPAVQALNPILVPRRVAPERGIDLAIEAFQVIHRERGDLSLLVVGDVGIRPYMEKVQELIHRHRLTGKVFFTGRVPHDCMAPFYRSAHLCLIPTLHSEGTSLSALESMACGCPTFSTAVGGLMDLPTIKIAMDPRELAEEVLRRLDERDAIGEMQRRTVQDNFTREKWVAAWDLVIQRCLGSPQ